jgi:hypothetical protein
MFRPSQAYSVSSRYPSWETESAISFLPCLRVSIPKKPQYGGAESVRVRNPSICVGPRIDPLFLIYKATIDKITVSLRAGGDAPGSLSGRLQADQYLCKHLPRIYRDFGGELSQPCLGSSCEFGREGECRDPDLSDVGMLELPPVGSGHLLPSLVGTDRRKQGVRFCSKWLWLVQTPHC